jgi:twitching motility protein PilT
LPKRFSKKKGGGRCAALEILIATDGIRNQVRQGEVHQIPLSIQGGKQIGMQTIDQALIELLEKDQVTYDDASIYAVNHKLIEKFAPLDVQKEIAETS